MYSEIVGYVGGIFYGVCYLPQIYDIWYDKCSKLSYNFMFLQFLASSFMFLYGITNELKPIWILNGWAWLCVIIIVSGMLRNKEPKRKIPSPPIRFPGNLGIENDLEEENILM